MMTLLIVYWKWLQKRLFTLLRDWPLTFRTALSVILLLQHCRVPVIVLLLCFSHSGFDWHAPALLHRWHQCLSADVPGADVTLLPSGSVSRWDFRSVEWDEGTLAGESWVRWVTASQWVPRESSHCWRFILGRVLVHPCLCPNLHTLTIHWWWWSTPVLGSTIKS